MHELKNVLVVGMGSVLVGAAYAWREGTKDEEEVAEKEASKHGVVLTAFVVIFLAEWGDITQITAANLAARYSPFPVFVGATLGLWAVAWVAVSIGLGRRSGRCRVSGRCSSPLSWESESSRTATPRCGLRCNSGTGSNISTRNPFPPRAATTSC